MFALAPCAKEKCWVVQCSWVWDLYPLSPITAGYSRWLVLCPAQRPLLMVYSGVGQLLSKVLGAFKQVFGLHIFILRDKNCS